MIMMYSLTVDAPIEYSCATCHRTLTQKRNRRRQEELKCDICGRYETHRPDNLKRHRLVCLNRFTRSVFSNKDASHSTLFYVKSHRFLHTTAPLSLVAFWSTRFEVRFCLLK